MRGKCQLMSTGSVMEPPAGTVACNTSEENVAVAWRRVRVIVVFDTSVGGKIIPEDMATIPPATAIPGMGLHVEVSPGGGQGHHPRFRRLRVSLRVGEEHAA